MYRPIVGRCIFYKKLPANKTYKISKKSGHTNKIFDLHLEAGVNYFIEQNVKYNFLMYPIARIKLKNSEQGKLEVNKLYLIPEIKCGILG